MYISPKPSVSNIPLSIDFSSTFQRVKIAACVVLAFYLIKEIYTHLEKKWNKEKVKVISPPKDIRHSHEDKDMKNLEEAISNLKEEFRQYDVATRNSNRELRDVIEKQKAMEARIKKRIEEQKEIVAELKDIVAIQNEVNARQSNMEAELKDIVATQNNIDVRSRDFDAKLKDIGAPQNDVEATIKFWNQFYTQLMHIYVPQPH